MPEKKHYGLGNEAGKRRKNGVHQPGNNLFEQTAMVTVLVCLLVLYNAWLVTYLLWERRQRGKGPGRDGTEEGKGSADAGEIIGRSLFRMEVAAKDVPQAASSPREEELLEEDVTFADEMPEKPKKETDEAEGMPQARIPDEELEEAFSDVRMEDIPVEYGDEAPGGTARIGYASGVSFEDIERAVHTAGDPGADERAQRHAGMVFSRMEGNELFDKLVQGSSSAGKKITELMERYLNNPAASKGERPETRETRSPDTPVIPGSVEDFNILDFV